jgi:hypothetical protein
MLPQDLSRSWITRHSAAAVERGPPQARECQPQPWAGFRPSTPRRIGPGPGRPRSAQAPRPWRRYETTQDSESAGLGDDQATGAGSPDRPLGDPPGGLSSPTPHPNLSTSVKSGLPPSSNRPRGRRGFADPRGGQAAGPPHRGSFRRNHQGGVSPPPQEASSFQTLEGIPRPWDPFARVVP